MDDGTIYVRLHHYADPAKDAEWLKAEEKKMQGTPDQFRREILMDETIHGGQPIYANYDDDLHVYRVDGVEANIPILPECLYFGGWDAGQALTPAFMLLQVMPAPFQVHAILEVTSGGGESMDQFAPRVLSEIMAVLPGNWDMVDHYGDATVTTRSGSTGLTARDVAKKHGIHIKPVSNVWAPRYAAMGWAFNRRISETRPGFKIDAKRCPIFRRACQGAYKYRVSASGDTGGPGQVLLSPLKNSYSHVAEAPQYPMVKIRRMIEGSGARLQEED